MTVSSKWVCTRCAASKKKFYILIQGCPFMFIQVGGRRRKPCQSIAICLTYYLSSLPRNCPWNRGLWSSLLDLIHYSTRLANTLKMSTFPPIFFRELETRKKGEQYFWEILSKISIIFFLQNSRSSPFLNSSGIQLTPFLVVWASANKKKRKSFRLDLWALAFEASVWPLWHVAFSLGKGGIFFLLFASV